MTSSELLPLSRATWSVLHDRHYFHHHRHRPHNHNLFTGEDEHSVQNLTKTSRSSNDPGAKGTRSNLLHLQTSENFTAIPTDSRDSSTSCKRYMCGKRPYFAPKHSSNANQKSDLSIQVVSRSCCSSIPNAWKLEIAYHL